MTPTPETSGRNLLPASQEAEQAVLGSLLLDPDAIIRVQTSLRGDDFYSERHKWIYQAICDLHERQASPDFITLCDELERRGQLEDAGGIGYVTALLNIVPTSVHAEQYAKIVERKAVMRRLIQAATSIVSLAYEDAADLEELIDRAEQLIFSVAQDRIQRETRHIREIVQEVVDRIEYLSQHRGQVVGVPSGFWELDEVLGGLQKSDLIILAARPGVGKTSLALSMALNAAKKHAQHIAFFSLEMSGEQLVQRLLASETGIDQQRLRLGDVHDHEWSILHDAAGTLSDMAFYVDDTPAATIMQLRTKARRLHAEYGLDMIVVDYLQLMQGGLKSDNNRVQEIAHISRSLKSLARELKIPVLALSQLSRSVESRQDKHPILSDLRESGSIEQDADVVMFIYRDELYNPDTEAKNIAELNIAKHRNGPTRTIQLFFKKELTQFASLETYREPLEP